MMRKAPVNLYIVTIIRVSKYFGNSRLVVNMLQLSGANCRAVIIIRVSKYFGNLRFGVMYTNLRVRTADIIGADVFQGIRVSFQST